MRTLTRRQHVGGEHPAQQLGPRATDLISAGAWTNTSSSRAFDGSVGQVP